MKKIFLLAIVAATGFLQSCEGPEGPMGPAGPEAEVFEVTTTFVNDPNPAFAYRSFFDLNPAIYQSDNILVYELAGVQSGLDVWKLLPQVYTFPAGGILQYNYDFTTNDFSIFMDANFDRSTLGGEWTMNRVFRIVIVPGYFSSGPNWRRAAPEYHDLMRQLNLKEADVKPLAEL